MVALSNLVLGLALAVTLLGAACACAVSLRRPRAWLGIGSAALMGASTIDMLAPVSVVPAIGWAAVLLLLSLLALLDRRRRADAAMTAAGFLVMSVMWIGMAAAPSTTATIDSHTVHAHQGGAPLGVALGVLAVLLAACLTVLAVRRHGRGRARGGIRVATLHQPAMSLGMLLMALGMTAPALIG
ncbi:hypothetical protein EV379_2576 [Microterricola gilva]|uniref:Uncharacterized protein n=1 Tax=Microterricola gilva TaxID=393267 RepID=A0A4Q8ANM8_9MICO|nr:hypothetical protein [Microterricola gilva]RZU66224.1 hypothetical protein EV379_2576 [Microterricola gilva]